MELANEDMEEGSVMPEINVFDRANGLSLS